MTNWWRHLKNADFNELLMSFSTKRRIFEGTEKNVQETWFIGNLRNFENEIKTTKITRRKKAGTYAPRTCAKRKKAERNIEQKIVKFVDLVKGFRRNSCVILYRTLVMIHTDPTAAAESGSFKFWEQKRMSTWRGEVRQVTNTVRRNIGAQNVNYGGPVQTFLRADKGVLGWDADE